MDIEFIRGDTQFIRFQLKDGNGNLLELSDTDNLYFTLKTDANSKKVLLQKKFPNDISYADGYYSFTINSEDTAKLDYREYQYDYVKTLGQGTITLTEEITFKEDE